MIILALPTTVGAFSVGTSSRMALELRRQSRSDRSDDDAGAAASTTLSQSAEDSITPEGALDNDSTSDPVNGPLKEYPTLNGWSPDENQFCWGLPGALEPMGNFDPLGLSNGISLNEIKRYREAEVTHGRVAMLATVGFLVSESDFHPLFSLMVRLYHPERRGLGTELTGPAIYHLEEVREVAPYFFETLVLSIAASEIYRCMVGWENPFQSSGDADENGFFVLRNDYYPGDIGFDPLGLKPSVLRNYPWVQNRELQNGRLAMIAIAGFVAQELVNGVPIIAHLFSLRAQ